MKKFSMKVKILGVIMLILLWAVSTAYAGNSVKISSPPDGAVVSNPVKVCMKVHGVEVEPAKKGVNDGKGHHHILVDVDVPSDLSKPIGKDAHHIHMGDGSTCKEIKLDAGKHTIRTLFAKGNHVPYSPPLTDSVQVTVK